MHFCGRMKAYKSKNGILREIWGAQSLESKARCAMIVRLQIMKGGLQLFSMYAIVQKEVFSMKNGMKRLVSGLLAIAMVLTTFGVNTKTASAEEWTMQNYVYDVYELHLGTDVNNPDTDSDTLTDYEELFISQTDATKYDSVTEGLSDAEADSDGDKLSNREEIEFATDVQDADTDNDTLTDYEEIEVYNTDPLKDDTDGDTLKDGDEIALGLDPLNPMTFGVPDAEYTVEQTITANSEVLKEINTDENEYRLAVDVTASGYVEGNLTAKETEYAAAIQNEFMVGIASELSYTNEDGIDSVTLTFELDDEVIGDSLDLFPGVEELSGIKRFNVFKYFEELNMLLPIETVVDEENNCIYATTDELGIYCVMDMERWLASFDVPEEVYQDVPVMFSMRPEISENETADERIIIDCIGTPQDMELVDAVTVDEASVEEEALIDAPMMFALKRDVDKTPVDVVFLLQSSGQLENTFINQKTMIYELLDDLGAEYGRGNVRFAVITYNLSGAEFLMSSEDDIWFTTTYDLRRTLNDLEYEYTSGYTDRGTALQKLQSDVEFKGNASKFIFQVMNGSTDVGNMYFDQISTCEKLGINYSELMPEGYVYIDPTYGQQVADAIASTNGMNATYGSTSQLQVYKHIVTYAAPPQMEFDAIVPTGWKHIVLDGILDAENGVNSDTDELTDWEEVNTERISWDTEGSVILPTVQDCIDFVEKTYAEDGLTRFKASQQAPGMPTTVFEKYLNYVLNNTYILPIHSDPTLADSDEDGIEDDEELDFESESHYSSPLSKDSDGDGIGDFSDPQPMLKNEEKDVNWEVWSGVNAEEYMAKRNITELVFKGVHFVALGNYHTSVIVFVSSKSEYYGDAYFTQSCSEWSENWGDIKYLTLGAGPETFPSGDPLICDYNREKDVMLDIKVQMVDLTTSSEVNEKIGNLLSCHQYFLDLKDESLPSYDLFPKDESEQNSNSYAHGLLLAAGIDDLGIPKYKVPGYQFPLSSKYFGVE